MTEKLVLERENEFEREKAILERKLPEVRRLRIVSAPMKLSPGEAGQKSESTDSLASTEEVIARSSGQDSAVKQSVLATGITESEVLTRVALSVESVDVVGLAAANPATC